MIIVCFFEDEKMRINKVIKSYRDLKEMVCRIPKLNGCISGGY